VHHSNVSCEQQERQDNLKTRLEEWAARNQVEIELDFIPWSQAPDRFEEAKAIPRRAPDISFVPSTWEETLRPHLEQIRSLNPIPMSEQCLLPSPTAIPLGCDVRLFFLWKDWLSDPTLIYRIENGLHDKPAGGHSGQEWDFEDVTVALAKTHHPFAVASNSGFDALHTFAYFLWSHGGNFLINPGRFDVDSALDSREVQKTLQALSTMCGDGQLEVHQVHTLELENSFLRREVSREVGMIMASPTLLFRESKRCAKAPSTDGIPCPELKDLVAYLPGSANGGPPRPFLGGSYLAVWKHSEHSAEDLGRLESLANGLAGIIQEQPPSTNDTAREYLHSISLVLPSDFEVTKGTESACPLAGSTFSADVRDQARSNCARVAEAFRAGMRLPADPRWLSSVETPAVVSKLASVWMELDNLPRAQADLQSINRQIHDHIAWWPEHRLYCAFSCAILFATLTIILSLKAIRARTRKSEREASLRVALSGEGSLCMGLESLTVARMAIQNRDDGALQRSLVQARQSIAQAIDQIKAATLKSGSRPESISVVQLMTATSPFLPFTLRPTGMPDGQDPAMVHLTIHHFVEALIVIAPLILPRDNDDCSTRTIPLTLAQKYVTLLFHCQSTLSTMAETAAGRDPSSQSVHARITHAAHAIRRASRDARLTWLRFSDSDGAASRIQLSITLPRFPQKRCQWWPLPGATQI
jgi:hypothetical protein